MGTEQRRARAWVLVQAEEAQEVAKRIRDLDPGEGDEFVVIRADTFEGPEGYPYNVMVPVDAKNRGKLTDVVGMIRAVDGVSEAVELRAEKYHPDPPHDAHGFVTGNEAGAGRDEAIKLKPGRQKWASPGANPWG